MFNRPTMRRAWAAGLVLLFAVCSGALAFPLINVDYNDDTPPAANYIGAAVIGKPGDQWNYVTHASGTTVTATGLVDAAGNPSPVTITVTEPVAIYGFNRDGQSNFLLDDYLVHVNGSATFSIANLVPGLGYDLYLYSTAGSDGYGGTFTINGNTKVASGGWTGAYVQNVNYVKFTGISADSSGAITGSWTAGNFYGILNGIQLIPEPATATILIGAGALLISRRRRHDRSASQCS